MKITILPLILSLSLLVACGGEKPGQPRTAAAVAVQVQTVAAVDWPSTYEATGTVRAKNVAVISSRMMAYARQVNFQAGDRVRAGQLLVELDSQDSDTQVRQAEAAHREASEALQEVDGAIESAKANLELAQATFRRMEDLFQKKSISNQEYDEASARLKVARAAYEMATAKRKQVASKVSQAAEGMKAAAITKEYARVTAPFDGVVTEKRVELGNLVTPGAPLATVEREGAYRLEASVEESRMSEIRVGQSVSVALDRVLEARVSEIAPSVDAASRSYIVKIDLPALPLLRSGMFGRAIFTLGKRSALAIPAAAVREQGQLRSVLMAEGGVARARLVTLGEEHGDRREVLSGLTAGEKIVFPVPAGLVDGAKVEVRPVSYGIAGKITAAWMQSKLTPLVILAALALGAFSVWKLPREEEPQIIVPMIDVFVQMPGASAREVEERVTKPMEKLLWEVPGVEYVYSTSSPGMSLAIVRFYVGQDEEKSIVRLNQKMQANFDLIPPGASQPLIKPRSIDDVPILSLTFWSRRYDDYQMRRVVAQIHDAVKQVPDVSAATIIGGQRREIRVTLDQGKLSAYSMTPMQVYGALGASNRKLPSGSFASGNREFLLETGEFLRTADDVRDVVIGVANNRPIFVRDIAEVSDGGEEPTNYVQHAAGGSFYPAVTLAISKRKGTNAIDIARAVLARVTVPSDVEMTVSRNYGETAAEKSNELLLHMLIAVISVSILIWLTLGFRESLIVFLAIPVTLSLTLTVFYLYGYTLNRITLFALIFSIGILVDDAIVVLENIVRHARLPANAGRPLMEVGIEAVDEVGNPTILATLAVIAAILPMAFVGGLMGPYMRPIPIGASAAMVFSLLVALVVTPWAAVRILRIGPGHVHGEQEDRLTLVYRRVMGPLLHRPVLRWGFLAMVAGLLLGSCGLVYIEFVKVKMLPFDNKSEFQVIVDMPEGTTLEQTARVTRELAGAILPQPEVTHLQTYVGTASPYNFNGLVRHYYLRAGANVADIQVNLLGKGERSQQSHDIAKRVRLSLTPIAARYGARVKVAEVPPGPPVLQTLVAEIYGPTQEGQIALARRIKSIFEKTDGIVDVDWYVEDDQPKYKLIIDKEKAALHGISEDDVAKTMRIASAGEAAGLLHVDSEKEDVAIRLRLDRAMRSDLEKIQELKIQGRTGDVVPLRELVRAEEGVADKSIYHKNLMPVTYVTADVAGAMESPVYAVLSTGPKIGDIRMPQGYSIEQYTARLPADDSRYAMKWDGEWHITYEVFRDLGLAFAVVLLLIYVLVVGWFQSFVTPLVIMAAIPFSLVGILPAHGLMHAFFSATSMIGFIAGAGIVVRNSIILVDFIELRLKEGMPLDAAVIDAGAIRFRPMLLTAAAVVVGSAVILFDPIFQGLAIALMAGEIASLLLSRMTVPVVYYIVNRRRVSV